MRPNLAFNTVVLVTLVKNHLSDYESITDEYGAKAFVPDSGPFNAGVESYECLIRVLEMNVRRNLAFNTVVLVMLV